MDAGMPSSIFRTGWLASTVMKHRRPSNDGCSLRGGGLIPKGGGVRERNGRHRLEHAVTPDQRMEERRGDVQQYHRKKYESQIVVRVPEQGVQAVALWQQGRKTNASVQHDRVG